MCRFPECKIIKLQRWGLCNKHRKWIERGFYDVDLNLLKPLPVVKRYSGCKMEDCLEKHRRNGFCSRHDSMYKRGSIDLKGHRVRPLVRYSKDFECIKCGARGKITKGFCKLHYSQFQKGQIGFDGSPGKRPGRVARYGRDAVCKIATCSRRPRIRGHCALCWYKMKRGSIDATGRRLEPPLWKNQGKTCRKPGCVEPAHCRGFCALHYSRSRFPERELLNKGKKCKAVGCSDESYCRSYCIRHYARWKRRRDLNPVVSHESAGTT